MKKKIIIYLIAILTPCIAPAQAAYQQGSNVLGLGIGLGSSFGGLSYSQQSPAFNAQFERGIWPLGKGIVSMGGYAGVKSFRYNGNYYGGYSYTEKWNYTILGLRSAWHPQSLGGKELKKWDLYGGVMLSYNILRYSYTDNDPNWDYANNAYGSAFGFSGYLGARYFFKPNLAVMSEAGYGISYLNIGLACRF